LCDSCVLCKIFLVYKMAEIKSLTTKEVARLCRVSDATVKRWHDAGLLKSERTSGGHRRFSAEEVCRFQREQGLSLKVSYGDEANQITAAQRLPKKDYSNFTYFEKDSPSSLFFNAIIGGLQEEAANILINQFINGGKLSSIFDTTISDAMRCIGELWLMGELTVAQEHLATRTAVSALHKLRSVLPIAESIGKVVICCSVEGDFHELPTYLVQLVFENQGFEVINFGANTPLYSLSEEINHYSPALICISITTSDNIERTSYDYKQLREKTSELKIPIVVGGRIFNENNVSNRFPADFYAASFTQLSEYSQELIKANF
jgi:MerR family transcriptional regulator, light-induced transcriptional regulator